VVDLVSRVEQNAESAAAAGGTGGGVDNACAFDVLGSVVAGQGVGGLLALLDQSSAGVDLSSVR
jgi:hypothetical protein